VPGLNYIREHQQAMKLRTKKTSALVLAATAAMAVGGIGTGSANASLLAPCSTSASPIAGEGSSLQGVAQSIWTGAVGTAGFNRNTTAGSGACTGVGSATARYTVTSSGRFMNGRWGADGVTPFSNAVQFGGTDDAPTAGQITNLNTNLRASVLSIPVAQAAIAILANPQTGCTVRSITPAELERVFRGTITSWASLADTNGGCAGDAITRVVRSDSSGTSYQLKHYLGAQLAANTNVCSARTASWADLQSSANNLVWPGTCDGPPSTGVTYAASTGGPGEVSAVAATTGTIGYAALSDARAGVGTSNFTWIPIQTGSTALTIYNPSTNGVSATRANANCTTATSAYGASLPAATASWAGIYLTTPGRNYPLCTLTWDLASSDYSTGAFGTAAAGRAIGSTVRDYLNYVNQTTGGVADGLTSRNDYQKLPTDVQSAAATGITSIVD
jgi:ABC-type phosphate transport system substrate-binding protein